MSDAVNQRIIDLNKVGLSLSTIGRVVGLHHTTIKLRLLENGEHPADTRRAFMEDIFNMLSVSDQEKLINHLQTKPSVKEYIRELILRDL